MAVQAVPTKGNLMNTKKSLALAKMGYELMDKKRNILIREMMMLIDKANEIKAHYKVMSIPALKIFSKGEIVKEAVGFMSREELKKFISE